VAGLTAPARRLQQPSLPTERAAAKIRLDVRGQLTSLINDFCNKICHELKSAPLSCVSPWDVHWGFTEAEAQ
jgi:hypothetical protein